MVKITNRKERYQSRSKNAYSRISEHKENLEVRRSREDFVVDRNGYFVWGFCKKSKNI